MTIPRLLVIVGSGETGPTVARVHRQLFDQLATTATATIVDTPYGFQENADELSERTIDYFRQTTGRTVDVASYRRADVSPLEAARAVARIAGAQFVFAGPGSPSYALRQWAGGPIPDALASPGSGGRILVMASAAALTLGVVTIPVYEIYKVGADPTWLPGLDLLGRLTGLRAAVVPHFDNAEGGTHDTRFCYMGERRLAVLERAMPDDAFILGVDGHTALIIDLDRRSATVAGVGRATIRVLGRSAVLPRGSTTTLDRMEAIVARLRSAEGDATEAMAERGDLDVGAELGAPTIDGALVEDPTQIAVSAAGRALEAADPSGVVGAVLALDEALEARLRAGEDSPDVDRARTTFRSLIVRLGDLAARSDSATAASADSSERLVDAVVAVRSRARAAGDFATSDLIRAHLDDAGIDVHDGPDGTTWNRR